GNRTENYGKAGEVFIHKDKGFGLTRLETRPVVEIAKWTWTICLSMESSRVCAYLLSVRNLPQYVSNEPLEEAFSVWPGGGPGLLWMTEEGPQGKALMSSQEVSCSEAGHKNLQLFHTERKQPPRFAPSGSLEYLAMHWKALRWRSNSRIKWTTTSRRLDLLDGTLGLTPPPTKCFGQVATMERIGAISGTPSACNSPAPGAEYAPNKGCPHYIKLQWLVSQYPYTKGPMD
ncbi:hypothetical protein A6R68_05355, partial [Neotoma lepida]